MIHELYAVKDTLVGFSQPFPMSNEAVALRSFAGAAQSPQQNNVNTNAEHKQLWYIGTFDDVTGALVSKPRYVADASQFLMPGMMPTKEKDDAGSA